MVLENGADCEAGKAGVFSSLIFLEIKHTQLAQGQKRIHALLAFIPVAAAH